MKFKEFLLEAELKSISKFWYHGSKQDFDKFDLKYIITKESIALFGPGFYLSTDREDSERYSGQNGYLKTIELINTSKIKNEKSKFNLKMVNDIIDNMPDKEDVLANWDENQKLAMQKLKQATIKSSKTLLEIVQDIWYDCYKGYEIELVKKLVEYGVDGFVVNKQNGVKHLICYNPEILKIDKIEKL